MFKKSSNISIVCLIFALSYLTISNAQFYNKDIEAKIEINYNNSFLEITGFAKNKTAVLSSVNYELSVIRNNIITNNSLKNSQSGTVVLKPSENFELSSTSIDASSKDRTIILLLIYDLNNKLIGKDRIVINDENENKVEQDLKTKESLVHNDSFEIAEEKKRDGIEIRGIVTEDTKTKAGSDFYKEFYSLYLRYNFNLKELIKVKEDFSLGRSTKIKVIEGNTIIADFFIQPKNDYITQIAQISIDNLSRYIQEKENDKERIIRY